MKTLKPISGILFFMLLAVISHGSPNNLDVTNTKTKVKLKGSVVDSISEMPVEYATVVLINPADSTLVCGVVTNEKGEFVLAEIPEGEYNLRVQFMGFNTIEVPNIEVKESKKTVELGTFKLPPTIMSLSEATVSAERRMIEYKLDKKVINASSNIAAAGGSAVEVLRNNPSVTVDIEDNVNLRGRTDYQVLINGRPSALSGPEAIKQIAAASVDRIEIITNPSAAYEASGTAGIINIILKENSRKGLGAFINLTAGNNRLVEDVNINYTKEKWNFVLGLSAMDIKMPVNIDRDRNFFNEDSLSLLKETALQYHITKTRNISFGADYDLNKRNLLSASLNAGTWLHIHDFESKYNLNDINRNEQFYSISENYFKIGYEFLTGNFNYKHLFPKKNHELTTNLYYSQINGYRNLDASHHNANSNWQNDTVTSKAKADEGSDTYNLRLNIDYKLPINENSNFETGTQLEHNPSASVMDFQNYDLNNNIWLTNDLFTNNVDFHTSIAAYYATFSQSYKKLEYQLGLRGEYYESLFDLNKPNEIYDYQSFDLFPSLHLSYKPSDKNQAQLSYSRRINRPTAWLMYPAPDFEDIYMRSEGNPELVPDFTDSYEMSFIRMIPKGLISAEVYHRQVNNPFTRMILRDEDGRLYLQNHNIGKMTSTGVELALNKTFNKSFSANISGTVYHYNLIADFMDFEDVESLTGNLRLNTNTIINKTMRLQVNLSYNAPFTTVQGEFTQNLGSIVSIRKDFPKINSSLGFTAQNPIYGRRYITNIDGENFSYKSNDLLQASYYFTFTYRLNNFKRHRSNIDNAGIGEGVG